MIRLDLKHDYVYLNDLLEENQSKNKRTEQIKQLKNQKVQR